MEKNNPAVPVKVYPTRTRSSLRALGVLLADGAPTEWGKKTAVTWKRKINLKVAKRRAGSPHSDCVCVCHIPVYCSEDIPFGNCQNGQNSAPRPENGLPSGKTATCRETKVIQNYLVIWETYDPIRSDPSDPKKWGSTQKPCIFGVSS